MRHSRPSSDWSAPTGQRRCRRSRPQRRRARRAAGGDLARARLLVDRVAALGRHRRRPGDHRQHPRHPALHPRSRCCRSLGRPRVDDGARRSRSPAPAAAPCSPTSTAPTSRRSARDGRVRVVRLERRRRGRASATCWLRRVRDRRPAPVAVDRGDRRDRRRRRAPPGDGARSSTSTAVAGSAGRLDDASTAPARARSTAELAAADRARARPAAPAARRLRRARLDAERQRDGRRAARRRPHRASSAASGRENEFTGEVDRAPRRGSSSPPRARLTALVLDGEQRNLYGGTASGELLWWHARRRRARRAPRASRPAARRSRRSTLLIGDRSLVVGQENGALAVWFPVRQARRAASGSTRDPRLPAACRRRSRRSRRRERDKGFLALDAAASSGSTTRPRSACSGRAGRRSPASTALVLAPKGDGAFVAGAGAARRARRSTTRTPRSRWRALFGKVWYEGYDEPELRLAVDQRHRRLRAQAQPHAAPRRHAQGHVLLAAARHPARRAAARCTPRSSCTRACKRVRQADGRDHGGAAQRGARLPRRALAGAARSSATFPALLLMVVVLPLVDPRSPGVAWERAAARASRGRFPAGTEVFLFVVVAGGRRLGLRRALAPAVRAARLRRQLPDLAARRRPACRYDQRNAVVVGLAMGFAVIPIIFAIAEDAFSNVPREPGRRARSRSAPTAGRR